MLSASRLCKRVCLPSRVSRFSSLASSKSYADGGDYGDEGYGGVDKGHSASGGGRSNDRYATDRYLRNNTRDYDGGERSGGHRYGGSDRYGRGDSYGNSDRYGGGGYGGNSSGPARGNNNKNFGSDLRRIDWDRETMKPFQKNLYVEHEDITKRPDEVTAQILKDLKATVRGKNVPKPIESFEHLRPTFGDGIMEEISQTEFEKPSPIQQFAWPILSAGRDSVGIAQTGSGKTLAYLLPALSHIQKQEPLEYGDGPIALVLGPTRELVSQIQDEAIKFGHITNIKNAVAYGGVPRGTQAGQIRRGAEILIACPGRLLDFLTSGVTNLKRVTYVVLDEADRMLDMGFEKDIRRIVGQCRPDRQTVMFSATWPQEIRQLARDFCREDPTMVTIGSTELQCNPDIKQEVLVTPEMERNSRFFEYMTMNVCNEENEVDDPYGDSQRNFGTKKVLIFTETKRGADELTKQMNYKRMKAAAIHGGKDQQNRQRVLNDFKEGRVDILVATDVAQRGLDIKGVEYVINYDVPKTIEDYIHRIGRTGRAGKKGKAVTFFCYDYYQPEKVRMAKQMCQAIADVGQQPSQKLMDIGKQRC